MYLIEEDLNNSKKPFDNNKNIDYYDSDIYKKKNDFFNNKLNINFISSAPSL